MPFAVYLSTGRLIFEFPLFIAAEFSLYPLISQRPRTKQMEPGRISNGN